MNKPNKPDKPDKPNKPKFADDERRRIRDVADEIKSAHRVVKK